MNKNRLKIFRAYMENIKSESDLDELLYILEGFFEGNMITAEEHETLVKEAKAKIKE
jgi:hypothetical protein